MHSKIGNGDLVLRHYGLIDGIQRHVMLPVLGIENYYFAGVGLESTTVTFINNHAAVKGDKVRFYVP